MATHSLTCKYCGATFTVRCNTEELRYYARCCKPCWDDDRPGMANWDRMVAALGERHALLLAASSHR